MFLKRFYDEGLAQASYLVGCQATGEAIVIDPARDTQPYHEVAKSEGLRLVAVTETHIHADFLSGSRQLAHETGATMMLSAEGGEDWSYQFVGSKDRLLREGDVIQIGNLSLEVLHTPGHTPEHLCLLLTDHPSSPEPMGIFSGDCVFVGDVGRPDLLERAAGQKDTMRLGAQRLYASLKRLAALPDHLQVWPGHGAGSACGKALGSVPSSVLGFEKLSNWAFRVGSEAAFTEEILSGQPEPPAYFAEMKRLNKEGPPLLDGRTPPLQGAAELAAWLAAGEMLIDLRGSEAFVRGHLPGSLFLPDGKALVTWAGWLLPYDRPFAVLLGEGADPALVLSALRSIGLDQLRAFYPPAAIDCKNLRGSERMTAGQIDLSTDYVLDVRSQKEYEAGHLPGAHHIHLGELGKHLDEIPDNPVIHCQSGLRSLIAASLLERAGKHPSDVVGGYKAIQAVQMAGLPG